MRMGSNFTLKAIDAQGKILIQEVAEFKRYKGRPQHVEGGWKGVESRGRISSAKATVGSCG